jgi:hypothetical protein
MAGLKAPCEVAMGARWRRREGEGDSSGGLGGTMGCYRRGLRPWELLRSPCTPCCCAVREEEEKEEREKKKEKEGKEKNVEIFPNLKKIRGEK